MKKLERVIGFEPTTSTLARLRSTPELHPPAGKSRLYEIAPGKCKAAASIPVLFKPASGAAILRRQ